MLVLRLFCLARFFSNKGLTPLPPKVLHNEIRGYFYAPAGASLHSLYVVTPEIITPELLFVMADPPPLHTKNWFSICDLLTQQFCTKITRQLWGTSQWARRDRLMSRGKNCRETIFVSHLSRNYPHRGVNLERG